MPLLLVCITDELNDLLLHYQRFKGNCSQAHLLLLGRSQRRLLPYILNSHSGIQAGKGRGALQRCPPIFPTESSAPMLGSQVPDCRKPAQIPQRRKHRLVTGPSFPILGAHMQEMKSANGRDSHVSMLMATWFTTAEMWARTKKRWYKHTMACYLVIKQ